MAWKDRMMVVKNCHFEVRMKGERMTDHNLDVICINDTYALIICKKQVLYTVMEPKISLILNNLLISTSEEGKYTNVKKI